MKFFDKIKNIFSEAESTVEDKGIYLYIQLEQGDEIVRLRLNPGSDLNPDYDRGGMFSRKTIIGPKTYKRAQAEFRFNDQYQLIDSEIEGGELVTEALWLAQEGETPSAG